MTLSVRSAQWLHLFWFLLRNLLFICAITIAIFLLVRVVPGDIVDVLSSEGDLTHQEQQALREKLGLDTSWTSQLVTWAGKVRQGDFGKSLRFNQPVKDMVLNAFPVTLHITAASFFFGLLIAIFLAVIAVAAPESRLAAFVEGLTLWSIAIPTFCVGVGLILIFCLWLRWMPILGNTSLAIVVIALDFAGTIVKPLYEELKETSSALFVRTAKSKGLSYWRVTFCHILPNSVSVVLALCGVCLGIMITGSITVEVLFGLSGLGKLLFEAVSGRGYPVIQAVSLGFAITLVCINTAVQILQHRIDPRLRS